MKKAVFLLLPILLTISAFGANHYVLPSPGLGTKDGSSWSNACSDFTGACASSSLVRGDTYYVGANGATAYASRNFNTATSGTSVITIKRATVTDHGLDTGWNAAYDAQVTWSSSVNFGSSYWMWDGVTGSMVRDSTQYGFYVNNNSSCSASQNINIGAGISNVTIQHFAQQSCSGSSHDVEYYAVWLGPGGGCSANASNNAIRFSYSKGFTSHVSFGGANGTLLEYNYWDGSWSSSNSHGDFMNFNACVNTGTTFRYNLFRDTMCGTITSVYTGQSPPIAAINGMDVYANVFVNMSSGCNGMIASTDQTSYITNLHFYNNTIVDSADQLYQPCDPGAQNCSPATGQIFEDNLFIRSSGAITLNGAPSPTQDYNSYYACSSPQSGTHNSTYSSGDPTVNSKGGNYLLTADTTAGLTLNSPAGITIDPDSVIRGSGGVWDRGAYEFVTTNALAPPTALQATVQ